MLSKYDGTTEFVFGVDLDGVVGDFYGFMRSIAAEWTGTPLNHLPEEATFGLREWGISDMNEYKRMHRFAVVQRDLFKSLSPIEGAPQGLRCLSHAGVRIRFITHRLFIEHEHQKAVSQTVHWLDYHGIPYTDLCFMRTKGDVAANVYVDDTPEHIQDLRARKQDVIVYTNSTNRDMPADADHRADNWPTLVDLVLGRKDRSLSTATAVSV